MNLIPRCSSTQVFDWDQLARSLESWQPSIDISEDSANYYVKADLPGLKKEDIQVRMEVDVITIRGERKQETEKKENKYYRSERSYGVFERSLIIRGIKSDEIKAKYQDGVLEVTLPKNEKAKAREINIA